jgi:hypothetical protein
MVEQNRERSRSVVFNFHLRDASGLARMFAFLFSCYRRLEEDQGKGACEHLFTSLDEIRLDETLLCLIARVEALHNIMKEVVHIHE